MDAVADGRRQRSVRSRDAVVDALLSLYDEGHLRPGVALIAERAGLSQSSVFRHFQDVDELVRTAIDHQWDRIRGHFDPPSAEGTLEERIDHLVRHRLRLHDAAGPALRAGRALAPDSPALQAAFGYRREVLRQQVVAQFAPELDAMDADRRSLVVDALDVATGLEQVESLRLDRSASVARTVATLSFTVRALLT